MNRDDILARLREHEAALRDIAHHIDLAADFATGLDKLKRFLHAGSRVARVGREHGLDADGIFPADADFPDKHFARFTARVMIKIGAVIWR